jgi:hypothetical protein
MKKFEIVLIILLIGIGITCIIGCYGLPFFKSNSTPVSNSNFVSNSNIKKEITTNNLITKFGEAGLSIKDKKQMTRQDLSLAPYVTDDMWVFTVQLEENTNEKMNGRLFKIDKDTDLQTLKSYFDELGKSSAMFYSYTYTKGKFLLQMNGEIDKTTFDKYVTIIDFNVN